MNDITANNSAPKKLWWPSQQQIEQCNLTRFIQQIQSQHPQVTDYDSLYSWSVNDSPAFWSEVAKFADIQFSQEASDILVNPDAMPGAEWFKGSRLNFAENLLRYRDDRTAIVFRSENGEQRQLSYAELYQKVNDCQKLLRSMDVKAGDRVAGYMSNNPETVIAMLATASLGAIWSSCSPDFGKKGVLERFSQITPKVLFTIDGYEYGGKSFDVVETVIEILEQIPEIENVVMVPFLNKAPDTSKIRNCCMWQEMEISSEEMEFAQLPFNHPLYILYSSGTTGVPKCIVHSAGGTLIQHLKEHQLHTDINREDVLFYFTTCGWMMWNWLVSGLASGCTVVLYDGSPFYPRRRSLWQFVSEQGITVFGTSARYIAAVAKARIKPGQDYDLSSLRAILSTGSPLAPEHFDYVYENVKSDLMLSSISGGTDIVSCFVLGSPMRPVYKGEIQSRGLGMAVDVYNDDGDSVRGERGELVCYKPFPSMPLGFWNQPDDQKYHDAYFSRFENTWAQGDYAEITERDGLIIYGRSDAVLNPGGVRIGTAEIYRQVEKVDEVLESLCIGQIWDNDVRIVLFVMLQDGVELDADIKQKIRRTIQENTTRRHVPKKIIAVPDIPRTISGKIVELAVRSIVHGDVVKNTEALANPESLQYFKDIQELAES